MVGLTLRYNHSNPSCGNHGNQHGSSAACALSEWLDACRVCFSLTTAPAHLRYSGTAAGQSPKNSGFSLEGLCPHHEQAFAAQLMAQQLQNMTGGNTLRQSRAQCSM